MATQYMHGTHTATTNEQSQDAHIHTHTTCMRTHHPELKVHCSRTSMTTGHLQKGVHCHPYHSPDCSHYRAVSPNTSSSNWAWPVLLNSISAPSVALILMGCYPEVSVLSPRG